MHADFMVKLLRFDVVIRNPRPGVASQRWIQTEIDSTRKQVVVSRRPYGRSQRNFLIHQIRKSNPDFPMDFADGIISLLKRLGGQRGYPMKGL
jgi:hypothetical protein